MTRTEISQPVVAANWLHVRHVTFTAKVASSGEIHLKRFHVVVVVGNSCASHLDVITSEEEQESIASEANHIRHEDELHCTFRLELKSFEEKSPDENANTGSRDGDGSSKHAERNFKCLNFER